MCQCGDGDTSQELEQQHYEEIKEWQEKFYQMTNELTLIREQFSSYKEMSTQSSNHQKETAEQLGSKILALIGKNKELAELNDGLVTETQDQVSVLREARHARRVEVYDLQKQLEESKLGNFDVEEIKLRHASELTLKNIEITQLKEMKQHSEVQIEKLAALL